MTVHDLIPELQRRSRESLTMPDFIMVSSGAFAYLSQYTSTFDPRPADVFGIPVHISMRLTGLDVAMAVEMTINDELIPRGVTNHPLTITEGLQQAMEDMGILRPTFLGKSPPSSVSSSRDVEF